MIRENDTVYILKSFQKRWYWFLWTKENFWEVDIIVHKHVKSRSVFTPFPNDCLRVLDNTIKIEEVRGFQLFCFVLSRVLSLHCSLPSGACFMFRFWVLWLTGFQFGWVSKRHWLEIRGQKEGNVGWIRPYFFSALGLSRSCIPPWPQPQEDPNTVWATVTQGCWSRLNGY